MNSTTSIGRGPASGGNENHDGDPMHTTMGETVVHEPPAGSIVSDETSQDKRADDETAEATKKTQPGKTASTRGRDRA